MPHTFKLLVLIYNLTSISFLFYVLSHSETKLVEESAGQYRPWSTLDTPGSNGGEEGTWNFAGVLSQI